MLLAMPSARRTRPAGEASEVRHDVVGRLTLFEKPEHCEAFFRVLDATWAQVSSLLFPTAVMSKHRHFAVHRTVGGRVSTFFRRLTVTHPVCGHGRCCAGGGGICTGATSSRFLSGPRLRRFVIRRRNDWRSLFSKEGETCVQSW